MPNERKERVVVTKDGDYARQERVVEYERSTNQIVLSRINQLFALIVAVLNILLIMRFAMQLIVANVGNGFVDFIYSVTTPLVTPFQSIVSNPVMANGAVVDYSTIFAIVVYTIGAWILVTLINIVFADKGGTKLVSQYEQVS